MSFGGSVLAMIISLKNNARPKRKVFGSLDEYNKNQVHWRTKLKFKEIPKDELEELKNTIRIKARKRRKIQILFTIIIFSASICTGFIIFKPIIEKQKRSREIIEKRKNLENQRRNNEFIIRINKGYKHLENREYYQAKKEIYGAFNIFPNDFRVHYAYTKIFVIECIETSRNCDLVEKMLKRLEDKFPQEVAVDDLKYEYFEFKNKLN